MSTSSCAKGAEGEKDNPNKGTHVRSQRLHTGHPADCASGLVHFTAWTAGSILQALKQLCVNLLTSFTIHQKHDVAARDMRSSCHLVGGRLEKRRRMVNDPQPVQ